MTWNPDKYYQAWLFAARAHQGQTYGGPGDGERFPYLQHVGTVAMEFLHGAQGDQTCDVDLGVQCALLHDTIEDTSVTYPQVAAEFGTAVAAGVSALSKDPYLPNKSAQMADSLLRIHQQPREVWMVKLADRIANLSEPPPSWPTDKRLRYQQEAEQILTVLGAASPALAARLRQRIDRYSGFIQA